MTPPRRQFLWSSIALSSSWYGLGVLLSEIADIRLPVVVLRDLRQAIPYCGYCQQHGIQHTH